MCSRIEYETGTGSFITGRGMDWNDPTAKTRLWAFPRGMQRDGGAGSKPVRWTSKYGSLITSFYDVASSDGMNEAGLVANVLYLTESDYGDAASSGKSTLSIGAWAQYALDNFGTVAEAVEGLREPPFSIVSPTLPNGRGATVHLSLSDPTGDSAILEYVDGRVKVHHGREFRVMTNSPTYDQQLAIDAYWDLIGGARFLPGTINAADRFVRLSYFLKSAPKYEDRTMAVACVFSMMRAIGVPLGMEDPEHPNISATLWRTVADHEARRYYFESTIQPVVFWVDLENLDLSEQSVPRSLDIDAPRKLAGEVSHAFEPATPFPWLGAERGPAAPRVEQPPPAV